MPAAAAVYDPALPEQTGISLFFNTGTGQLAVTLKNAKIGADPDKTFAASETDHPGNITNPSEMASTSFRGFKIVVAVTTPNTTENPPTTNQISVVSPVYMGLSTNSFTNKKVTCSSSGTNAWVYFLNGPAGEVELKEYNYERGTVTRYATNRDITLNSSLGAWYDITADERFVIYQEANSKRLKEFSVVSEVAQDIVSTLGAKENTSVAVTWFAGIVYLYYSNTSDAVVRVTKNAGRWSDPERVRDSPPIGSDQLTVVTANGYNHLFYMSRDDSRLAARGFTHIADPLPN